MNGFRLMNKGLSAVGLADQEVRHKIVTLSIPHGPRRGLLRRLFRLKAPEPDWRDYETAAAHFLRGLGFRSVESAGPGSDGGVDARVPGVLVGQVKAHKAKVGRPPLQQIFGIASEEGVDAIFFSKAGYTKTATEWADNSGIGLFVVNYSGEDFVVRTVNRLATRVKPNRY
jgi:hypothetical protein